jgi:hypothetical protein
VYSIATALDPRYKEFHFAGADARLRTHAHAAAKAEYIANWSHLPGQSVEVLVPVDVAHPIAESDGQSSMSPPANAHPTTSVQFTKKRKVSLVGCTAGAVSRKEQALPTAHVAKHEMERYLIDVLEVDLETDLLEWWRDICEAQYPRVARMARQFLGCPATSAGVERLFSKCGRAYNSLTQSQNEGTLEDKMFAGINIQKCADFETDEESSDSE